MVGAGVVLLAALALQLGLLVFAGTVAAEPRSEEMRLAVRDLAADHDRATAALYVLQSGGEPAARAIEAAWTSLSVLGQRRAIGALRTTSGSR